MSTPLELYRLALTVYGALHVGTGENFPAYAYVPDERAGCVYLLDTTILLGLLDAKEQQEFIRRVEASPKQAQSSLKALWERDAARLQGALIREVEASRAFFGTLANADRDLAAAEFRPLPVSLGGPYVPGSSLKGALRTAWLADLASKELETADLATVGNRGWQRQVPLDPEGGLIRLKTKPTTGLAQGLEALLLGNLNDRRGSPDHYRDPFRALRLSDSAPLQRTRLERLGVVHENEKKQMNVLILAETVPERTTLDFTVSFHTGLMQSQGGRPAGVSGKIDPGELVEVAGWFYGGLLDAEHDYAEDTGLENISRTYDAMRAELRRDSELFPLRFGFGSGKFATTLADYMGEGETKTRKTAGSQDPRGGVPLGWALAKLEPL